MSARRRGDVSRLEGFSDAVFGFAIRPATVAGAMVGRRRRREARETSVPPLTN
jgi:hypothetical protein